MSTSQFDTFAPGSAKPGLWRKLKNRNLAVLIAWTALAAAGFIVLCPMLLYNSTRILGGPEKLSVKQLSSRLAEPVPLEWKIQSLQLPKLPATGSAFGLSRGEEDIYDYHYTLVGNQLLVTQVEASNETPTTGELRKLTGATAAWANKQLATVGKDVTLAPYLFDTTSNVTEKLRGIVPAITFLLVFLLFAVRHAWRSFKDPLRVLVGDNREIDNAYLATVDSLLPHVGWHRTSFVDGHLAYRGPYGYKAVAASEVMWTYYRKRVFRKRAGDVLEVRTTRGQSLAFPLRKAAELEELQQSVDAINPFAYRGISNDASIAWRRNRRLLGESFKQLQSDPVHRAAYAAENRLHMTVWLAAKRTLANSAGPSTPKAQLKALLDCRTGAWRAATAGSSIASIATVTVVVVVGGMFQAVTQTAQAKPTSWSAEVKPLAEFVEQVRGGAFTSVVPVDLLDSKAYDLVAGNAAPETVETCPQRKSPSGQSSIVEEADLCEGGSAPDLRRIAFELLGMKYAKPTTASADAQKSIGFYSPADKRLYVRGTTLTNEIKTVLVHELTHAWQDQRFDLAATKPKTVETMVAWKSLVEGDATFVERSYSATLPESKTRDTTNDDLNTDAEVSSYDQGLILPAVFPYSAGAAYVKRLRESGSAASVDQVFANPPLRIAEVLPYGSVHKTITDLEATPPLPVGGTTTTPEKSLYTEDLDLLSFYALVAEDQAIPLQALSPEFEGASIELLGGVGYVCAELRARSSFGLWSGTYNTVDKVIVKQRNFSNEPDSAMRCSFDLQPGWRSRLASPRNVVVPENEDGFSLALKDPESTKSELGRWYMAASLAGNTKTTSLMDWCVAAAVSASVDQLRGSDSLPEDLIDSLSRDCRIPPDALHR